jgi:hypothetical protein
MLDFYILSTILAPSSGIERYMYELDASQLIPECTVDH